MVKAQVTWAGPGLRLIGETESSPAIVIDSSSGEYGTHSGPSPMELIIIGLASCTAMDVVSIMEKKREPMTNLQVKVDGARAESHPKVYTHIKLEYIAYGTGINENSLHRAIELSEKRYCPVHAMLMKTAEISSSYRIVEQANPSKPGKLSDAE
jgi:putative redox protein